MSSAKHDAVDTKLKQKVKPQIHGMSLFSNKLRSATAASAKKTKSLKEEVLVKLYIQIKQFHQSVKATHKLYNG